jgi:hypothetical protein
MAKLKLRSTAKSSGLVYREQTMTDLRPMTGPLKLAVFVALCAIMFVIVVATGGNPLVVIALILSAMFLAGRLFGSDKPP